MDFITEEDWREYGGLKRPDVEPGVEMKIAAANALMNQLLGMDTAATTTDLLPTKPARVKYFMSSPGQNLVTDMTINGVEIAPEQYKVYADGTIFLKFSPAAGYMEVTYTAAGFTTVPADLKLAGCLLVDFWVKQDYRESRTIGGETVQFNTRKSGVPEHIRTIIEVYRRL